MIQATSTSVRRQAGDQEQFTPGPRVLVHLAAHLWRRTSARVRVGSIGLLVIGVARAAGLT